MIRLAVAPLGNHGADSTRVVLEIAEVDGPGRWSLGADLLDDLLAGNPHADRDGHRAVWWFLDGRPGRGLLPEPVRDLDGRAGLQVWRDGDTPSVFVNAGEAEVAGLDGPAAPLGLRPPGAGRAGRDRLAEPDLGPSADRRSDHRRPSRRPRRRLLVDRAPPGRPPRRPPPAGRAGREAGRTGPAAGRSGGERPPAGDGLCRRGGDRDGLADPPPGRSGEARPGGPPSLAGGAGRPGRRAGPGQRSPRPGRLADRAVEPARAPGDGQPDLAAPLRPRARRDAQRLRHARAPADASRSARLAGLAVRRGRLVDQGDAPTDHALGRLPAVGRGRAGRPRRSIPTTRSAAALPGGAWTPRRSATACSSSPTARPRARRAAPVPAGELLGIHPAQSVHHLL